MQETPGLRDAVGMSMLGGKHAPEEGSVHAPEEGGMRYVLTCVCFVTESVCVLAWGLVTVWIWLCDVVIVKG